MVNAGFNLAFAVWILNAYFGSIPVELEEAAMVDGSSRLGTLLRVTQARRKWRCLRSGRTPWSLPRPQHIPEHVSMLGWRSAGAVTGARPG